MTRVSETVILPHDQLALTDRTALVLMLVHAFHHIVRLHLCVDMEAVNCDYY